MIAFIFGDETKWHTYLVSNDPKESEDVREHRAATRTMLPFYILQAKVFVRHIMQHATNVSTSFYISCSSRRNGVPSHWWEQRRAVRRFTADRTLFLQTLAQLRLFIIQSSFVLRFGIWFSSAVFDTFELYPHKKSSLRKPAQTKQYKKIFDVCSIDFRAADLVFIFSFNYLYTHWKMSTEQYYCLHKNKIRDFNEY